MEKYILICDDESNGFSARSLRAELKDTNIKCLSLSDMPGIAAYPDQIIKVLEGAVCIIIAMTSHSGSSSLINNIVNMAQKQHKPLIAFNLDGNYHVSAEMQYALSAIRMITNPEELVRMLEPVFANDQPNDAYSKSAKSQPADAHSKSSNSYPDNAHSKSSNDYSSLDFTISKDSLPESFESTEAVPLSAETGSISGSISKSGAEEEMSMASSEPEPENVGKTAYMHNDFFGNEIKKQDPQPEKEKKKRGILGLFGRKDKKTDQPAPAASEKANFSVISPKAVSPDSYGLIDLYMYTDEQRTIVDEAIRKAEGPVKETSKKGFEVARNTSVTARLESDDVEIRDNIDTQIWNGSSLHFDFSFFVPAEYSRSQAAFTCYIEYNGIPVTRLNFLVSVTKAAGKDTIPAKVTQSDYHKAFISYSRKDEQRMLARVLGIQQLAPDLSFWLDKQSMDAGVIWRDEIRDAILISDVLLLFWSVAASQSSEVEKEWSFAFENRGLEFIAPVPLDPPDKCPPPDKLSPLNFSVREFSQNEITRKLSFYDSRNIKLV